MRLGRYSDRAAAEAESRKLVRFGVDNSWIVSEGAALAEAALDLQHRGKSYHVAGRSFVLAAPPGSGVRWEGRRYRGQLVVFLNDRGRLNLVNELPIEQYLRGVVPRELGPGAYPELEALKAQAIAARSYTLRNLGEFADEGYDLCGTPRCQVYGGMDDEHPLSDRAVAETAGEILLYGGQPIDALYSATCGGHTENVEVIFPLKRAPYLRGVPCIEAGEVKLRSEARGPVRLARVLLDRAIPGLPAQLDGAAEVDRALHLLADAAGLVTPEDHLATLERREMQRFLGSMFDLAADARLFVRPEELDYLVANPPPEWNVEDRRLAAYLVQSGLLARPAVPVSLCAGDRARDREVAPAVGALPAPGRAAGSELLGSLRGRRTRARGPRRRRRAALHPATRPRDLSHRGRRDASRRSLARGRRRSAPLSRRRAGSSRSRRRSIRAARASTAPTTCRAGRAFAATATCAPRWRRACPGFEFRSFEVLPRGVSGRVGQDPAPRPRLGDGRRRGARGALDARRARHPVHRAAARAGEGRSGLAVLRTRLGPRRRPLPGRVLRHGAARSRLPRHPRRTTTAARALQKIAYAAEPRAPVARAPADARRALQLPLQERRGSIVRLHRSRNGLFPDRRTARHS